MPVVMPVGMQNIMHSRKPGVREEAISDSYNLKKG